MVAWFVNVSSLCFWSSAINILSVVFMYINFGCCLLYLKLSLTILILWVHSQPKLYLTVVTGSLISECIVTTFSIYIWNLLCCLFKPIQPMLCLFDSFSYLLSITKVICLKATNFSALHQGLLGTGMPVWVEWVDCLLVVLRQQLLHTVLTIFLMVTMDMEDMVTCPMGNSSMASSSMENSASMGNLSTESLASMVCSGSGSDLIYICTYNCDSECCCCWLLL